LRSGNALKSTEIQVYAVTNRAARAPQMQQRISLGASASANWVALEPFEVLTLRLDAAAWRPRARG